MKNKIKLGNGYGPSGVFFQFLFWPYHKSQRSQSFGEMGFAGFCIQFIIPSRATSLALGIEQLLDFVLNV